MQCRFKQNDIVEIHYRDETVQGKVTNITDTTFDVVNDNDDIIATLPNDVGSYVTLV